MLNPVQSSTVSRGPLVASPPFQSFDNRRFASAGENAMMSARPPQMSQSPGYLVCWDCGIPGHVRRDCPGRSRAPPNHKSQGNTANRHSRKMQDKTRVYIKMKLLGKVIPCLMDSGCEATLVPKTVTNRFRKQKVQPAASRVWAANDTPIRINGEVHFPFYIEDHCIWGQL